MKSSWLEQYILLFLRVDKLFISNGDYYIDAYIGPKRLKEKVYKEKIKPPDALIRDADNLLEKLAEKSMIIQEKIT